MTEMPFKYSRPPSLLGKLLAFILGSTFLVLAFMFSLVALAVIALGGLMIWGWLWWKTRAIRQQVREQAPATYSTPDNNAGQIIDVEIIRERQRSAKPERPLTIK